MYMYSYIYIYIYMYIYIYLQIHTFLLPCVEYVYKYVYNIIKTEEGHISSPKSLVGNFQFKHSAIRGRVENHLPCHPLSTTKYLHVKRKLSDLRPWKSSARPPTTSPSTRHDMQRDGGS